MAVAMTGSGFPTRLFTRSLAGAQRAVRARAGDWGPEGGDAVLYAVSAGFALLTALFAGLAGYRVWAWLALGPYLLAAAVSAVVGRSHARRGAPSGPAAPAGGEAGSGAGSEVAAPAGGEARSGAGAGVGSRTAGRWRSARVWVFLLVLVGATIVPLAVEVTLRGANGHVSHVQPEVVVISQAGQRLATGKDPYHVTVEDGHVHSAVPGEPTYESFFPYLPLMALFGLSDSTRGPVRVTDTRLAFTVVTLLVVAGALAALRAPWGRKVRALQFLTVLPTAALPLATGGDDMPIVAFLLLAMVLAQRRRPGWSGLVLGVVCAMKFTAWPVALVALFAARDRAGHRTPGRMALGIAAVSGPVVVPFAMSNLRAFVDNVILFPLGLSGVKSPAASNLPGHVLVLYFPELHALLPATVAVVGGIVLLRHLLQRPPGSPAAVATLAGWVMLVAIAFAPATRVGYLLYPANLFVWGWMLREDPRSTAVVEPALVQPAMA